MKTLNTFLSAFWLLLLMAGMSPASAVTISYTYDDAGRLIEADYGGGLAISYTYDANGNLLSRQVDGGDTGSLKVTITPAGAVAAGAQWKRTEASVWRGSGETETRIPEGTTVVQFKNINGWGKPDNKTVQIEAGEITTASGQYIRHTGSLTVTIYPPEAASAGMQWRRQNTATWFDSGSTENNVPTGSYVIEFKPVDDYPNPSTAKVNVEQGSNTFTWDYTEAAKALPGVLMLLLDE